MATSNILRHGLPLHCCNNSGCDLCRDINRHVLLTIVCRRSPMVVEIIHQLRQRWIVLVHVFIVVPVVKIRPGWDFSHHGLFDIYVHDMYGIRIILWGGGCCLSFLVHSDCLRCSKSRLNYCAKHCKVPIWHMN